MTPNEYLLFSFQHFCYREKSWYYTAFGVARESEKTLQHRYVGRLIREPYGIFYLDEQLEKQPLSVKLDEKTPLFQITQKLTITPAWAKSLKEPQIETTIGRLLINHVCLIEAFGDRFPYVNDVLGSPQKLESVIAKKLTSTPPQGTARDPQRFYVDEYLIFSRGVSFLEQFTKLFSHSVTRIGLLPAPGRKEFKEQLLKTYSKDQLRDPVVMAKFEKELAAFDQEYLKQDPAYGKFMKGKPAKARMKSFMTYGGEENNFTNKTGIVPIIPALEEGIPLDAEGFTAMSNSNRYGSYSRGAETVNGGVTAKLMNKAGDTWRILEKDCGVKEGLEVTYGEDQIGDLQGRYVILGNEIKLIETFDEAKAFLNRKVFVRSPQYCRQSGAQTCQVCAGTALSKYPEGLIIPLTAMSGGVLTDSLKKMHNTALVTAEMDLIETIT